MCDAYATSVLASSYWAGAVAPRSTAPALNLSVNFECLSFLAHTPCDHSEDTVTNVLSMCTTKLLYNPRRLRKQTNVTNRVPYVPLVTLTLTGVLTFARAGWQSTEAWKAAFSSLRRGGQKIRITGERLSYSARLLANE